MFSRSIRRITCLIALAVVLWLPAAGFAAQRPNVVMLLADDLGFKDVGCYGGPVKTPSIDWLATNGTRFTDFYSGAAVCSPSRATLTTGRHHIRAGVYSWIYDQTQESHLLEREVTLAEILHGAGYATAHVGKWHLGLPMNGRDKPTPGDHGFDYWFATANNASPSHHNPDNFVRNGEPVGKLEGYSCQLVVDEAIGWLDNHRNPEKPFFLNVWFHEPHAPLAGPQNLIDAYLGDKPTKQEQRGALYSSTIDNTDRAIKRLLAKLKAVDLPENTLIIYSSDNGSYMADRVGNLRGKKGINWDGGIRVPGIFHWPGHIRAGHTAGSDLPAGLVDVLPTVCGLLDLPKPAGVHLDGTDLSAYLTGRAESVTRAQPLFWHLQKSRPIAAIRDGRYSLVAFPDFELSTNNMFDEAWIPAIKQGTYKGYELYDLVADPGQQENLAAEKPELVERMRKQLNAINASIMSDGPDWHLK